MVVVRVRERALRRARDAARTAADLDGVSGSLRPTDTDSGQAERQRRKAMPASTNPKVSYVAGGDGRVPTDGREPWARTRHEVIRNG
jgi:hypothetical protein